MPLRNLPRRMDSDTTHVSDSEPEREAYRRNNSAQSSSCESSAPGTPPTTRPPLSALSNTMLGTDIRAWRVLDDRLSAMEGALAEIKTELYAQRRYKQDRTLFTEDLPTSTPPQKRTRTMCSQCVGGDSPVGRLEEPRIHRSSLMASTLEREEMGRSLQEGLEQARLLIAPARKKTKSVGKHTP
ncbi:hypothetical protein C8J57DRAFT_1333294 [Mycena rebaudengoi]|nr:hypothetical protein C8J57DRAFT_1333294 [Mycena rebaudengoi]